MIPPDMILHLAVYKTNYKVVCIVEDQEILFSQTEQKRLVSPQRVVVHWYIEYATKSL